MKQWISERKQRIISDFYTFFGKDDYLNVREPSYIGVWICKSIEWQYFDSYKEAVEALSSIAKQIPNL